VVCVCVWVCVCMCVCVCVVCVCVCVLNFTTGDPSEMLLLAAAWRQTFEKQKDLW